jgi:DNA-binding response OmpR family regulator
MRKEGAVLLVDDDTELRDCVKEELEESGFVVRAAGDGGAALEVLRGWLPDLIVLDLNMPRVDGWEFRVQQLDDARLAAIPLLAMSADPSAKAAAINSDGFLKKPFSTVQLLSRIGEILSSARHNRERSALVGRPAACLIHEINNALSVVLGGLELIAVGVSDLATDPRESADAESATVAEMRNDVDASLAAAEQLKGLTEDLRALCGADDESPSSSWPSPSSPSSPSNRH